MSASTLRASLFALILFGVAGFLGYRHWTTPIDPDNGNLILDKDANVSGISAELARLGDLGTKATPDDVARLVTAMKDSDPSVRADAAMALGKVKSTDPEANKLLVEAIKDTDPRVRSSAVIAIDEVGRAAKTPEDPARARFEAAVIDRLKDETPLVRRVAVTSLRGRPEGSLTNIESIAKAELDTLDDPDGPTQMAAASALVDLPRIAGPSLGQGTVTLLVDAMPRMVKFLANSDMRSRPEYQNLLRTVSRTAQKSATTPPTAEQTKAIREVLAASLADPRDDARRGVAEVLPEIGALAGTEAERAQLLRPMLKDSNAQVRAVAYRTLWSLPLATLPEGEAIKAELREVTKGWIADLAKPEKSTREVAAWLLSWTDREDADAALAALAPLKEDKEDAVKKRAITAIETLEAGKSSGSWPEPSWKPFRTGPPPPMVGSPPPLSPPPRG